MDKKLDDEYAKKLKEANAKFDIEAGHSRADDLLCELLMKLGYVKVVDAFKAVEKWYA